MSDDTTTQTTQTTETQGGDQKPPWGDDFDADKAWKLIENLREDNKKRTNAEVASLQKQIADLKPLADEAQKLRDANKSDIEKLTERVTAAEASLKEANLQALRGEIKAMAAKDFADPEDAAAFLDPAKYLQVNGNYDPKAVESDLSDLLKRKPHLAREQTRTPRTPAPDRSQGSSGNSGKGPKSGRDAFIAFMDQARGSRSE